MRTLYWFRNDLRLSDHPGLVEAARADALLPVYLWPRSRPWCNQHGLGGQRERFLRESLLSLREELAALGQDLLLLDGSPELVLPDLVRDYAIDAVHTSSCAGTWEARTLDTLRGRLAVPVHEHRGNTLFEAQEITSLMPELPDTFSRFRRLVEKRTAARDTAAGAADPAGATGGAFSRHPTIGCRGAGGPAPARWQRGRRTPTAAVSWFTVTASAATRTRATASTRWKAPRPCRRGWPTATVGARGRAADTPSTRRRTASNESTYWLYFELLWREFFYWRALARRRCPVPPWRPRGYCGVIAAPSNRATSRAGAPATRTTPWSMRCMHQLVATGWMSNRGRQIAASCLVNDLRHRLALRCRILRKAPDRLRRGQQLRQLAVHRRRRRGPARRSGVQHREANRAIRSGGGVHGEVGWQPPAAARLRHRRRGLAPRSRGLSMRMAKRRRRQPRGAAQTPGGEDLPGCASARFTGGRAGKTTGTRWCTARGAARGGAPCSPARQLKPAPRA
jgi:deoxyribodipyrimidine photo-lyase